MIKLGQTLKDENRGDFLGYSTDINANGKIIAVGSPFAEKNELGSGKVEVFQLENNTWSLLGTKLYGNLQGEHFGTAVDLNSVGDIITIGSPGSNENGALSGKVSVFQFINNEWKPLGKPFLGKRPYDKLGSNVSLSNDGKTLAIGAPPNPKIEDDKGKIEVFTFTKNEKWIPLGNIIVGETYTSKKQYGINSSTDTQHIGEILQLSGDGKSLILGSNESTVFTQYSTFENYSVHQEHSVAVFRLKNNTWQLLGDIIFSEKEFESGFGDWVSINANGSVIAFGANYSMEYKYTDAGKDLFVGYVKTFHLTDDNKWEQLGNKLQGEEGDTFGIRFSLNGIGDKIAVTGNGYDPDDGPADMNYAYFFELKDNVWNMTKRKLKLEKAFEDYDMSVSLSAKEDIFIIGNNKMDSDNLTIGEVGVYKPK